MTRRFRKQRRARRPQKQELFSNNEPRRTRGDVRIVVGRKRVWIFANRGDLVIREGEYVILEIDRIYETRFGRAAELMFVKRAERPEEEAESYDFADHEML